jgi:hypothetical protein
LSSAISSAEKRVPPRIWFSKLPQAAGATARVMSRRTRGVLAYLELGVGIEPELDEAEEVVQVDLPVPFGIEAQGQVDPRELAGEPRPMSPEYSS